MLILKTSLEIFLESSQTSEMELSVIDIFLSYDYIFERFFFKQEIHEKFN